MTMRMTMICLIFLVYIGFIFTYKTFVVPFENSSCFFLIAREYNRL